VDGLALTLRCWVVLVFLAAVVGKLSGRAALRDLRTMLVAVGVPPSLAATTGLTLVVTEAAVVILGPWPYTGTLGMAVGTAVAVALTVGTAHAVRRGSAATCRCFGGRGGRLHVTHVLRNAVLTAAALTASIVSAAAPGRPVDLAVAAAGLVAAGAAAAIVIRWEDIAALFVDVPA
jgi:hypothetical protein